MPDITARFLPVNFLTFSCSHHYIKSLSLYSNVTSTISLLEYGQPLKRGTGLTF
jgi:hypothetical protein